MKKVVLLGYMGSGKSIIGDLISKFERKNFLDLDEVIENRMQKSIKIIFEQRGEIYFRKIEHEIFSELMKNSESFVLSLGGGTPCYANNHELLNLENVVSVYLRASIDTLYKRLSAETDKRPLLANKSEEELREFIAKHLFDRSFYYNQATIKIDVDDKSPQEIITEIKEKLA
ncbi:MAG: shikimate kinase [Flavobacterium sp.]